MHIVSSTAPSAPDPLPPATQRRGDGRNGFVIVRLRPEVGQSEAVDLRTHAEEVGLVELARALGGLGEPPSTRLVVSVAAGVLREAEADTERSPWPPLHSLTQYWRVDASGVGEPLENVVEFLGGQPGVDLVYLDTEVGDPAVDAADDPRSRDQGYLRESPQGIDAHWAWTRPGGDGAGIGILDVEERWVLDHEAFAAAPTMIEDGDNLGDVDGDGNHGTAVLAVVAAADDHRGVIGIAPQAGPVRVSSHFHCPGTTTLPRERWVTDAIAAAVLRSDPRPRAGDILLVEVELRGEQNLPAESDPANLDAIRLASGLGVVVVAAAGNGLVDLDTWLDPQDRMSLNPTLPDVFVDSGSIMVGSARSEVHPTPQGASEPPAGHEITGDSNHGGRVDCYAWGADVTTAGYGDPTSGTVRTQTYTDSFDGTSAATAIIAGAAALVQSIHAEATGGARLSPLQMRRLLSAAETGTPQYVAPGVVRQPIGVMPDLRRVVVALGLVPEVYLRDAVGDMGAVPSGGPVGQSPDVICRAVPEPDPVAAFGELSGTADNLLLDTGPLAGQDNTLYVRVRNRGATTARDVRALVYSTPVVTVQTPATWSVVGFSGPFDVPAGDTLTIAPGITWPAAEVPGTPRGLVVVLDSPDDPQPRLPAGLQWDTFVAVVQNTNNIAFRNVQVVDVPPVDGWPPVPMPFLLSGDPGQARRFDLRIETRLPVGTRLSLDLPPAATVALPAEWRDRPTRARRSGRTSIEVPRHGATLAGVRLPAGVMHRCRLLLEPSAGLAAGLHSVSVRQFFDGSPIGGITWTLRPVLPDRLQALLIAAQRR